jgi:uncharacterized protein
MGKIRVKVPEHVIRLWEKYGLDDGVRKHCLAVAEIAMDIATRMRKNGLEVDLEAVLIGSLLHDIGRAITHDPFQHFLKSAEILRKEGFSEKVVKIAERHFSSGLTAEEAEKLGLPQRNYLPETLEEKIVSFADNIALGNKKGSFDNFLKRLDEINLRFPELRWLTERTKKRALEIKREIERLSGMRF